MHRINVDANINRMGPCTNQALRLGVGESGTVLFSPHEARGLSQIPRALRLIEDYNTFRRRNGVEQCIVAKVMNVLDESFDTLGNFPLPH